MIKAFLPSDLFLPNKIMRQGHLLKWWNRKTSENKWGNISLDCMVNGKCCEIRNVSECPCLNCQRGKIKVCRRRKINGLRSRRRSKNPGCTRKEKSDQKSAKGASISDTLRKATGSLVFVLKFLLNGKYCAKCCTCINSQQRLLKM